MFYSMFCWIFLYFRDRLVFPPILGVIVYTATYYTWTFFLAGNFARLYLAGFLCGYVCYDLTHYYIHHGSPRSGHFSEMKTYHNKHHYKVAYAGYGITSKFWDYVWGTEIPEWKIKISLNKLGKNIGFFKSNWILENLIYIGKQF